MDNRFDDYGVYNAFVVVPEAHAQPAYLRDIEWHYFFQGGPLHRVRYVWADRSIGVLRGIREDGSEF